VNRSLPFSATPRNNERSPGRFLAGVRTLNLPPRPAPVSFLRVLACAPDVREPLLVAAPDDGVPARAPPLRRRFSWEVFGAGVATCVCGCWRGELPLSVGGRPGLRPRLDRPVRPSISWDQREKPLP